MRNRKLVEDNNMFVTGINDPAFVGVSAKEMASKLLNKEFRGPSDTIDAAAYRLQQRYGVDAEIVLQGRRRDIKEMKASRWLALFQAYWAAGLTKVDDLYEAERELHADNSPIVGLADFVAGKKNKG